MRSRLLLASVAAVLTLASARADDPKPLDPADFQKKLIELIQKGNAEPDDLLEIFQQMNKQMLEQMKGRMQLQPFPQLQPLQPFPQLQPLPGFGRERAAAPANELRKLYEKRLEEFEADIAKNKDNPEAQVELKKAREEYIKAMADDLKKADDEAKKNPVRPGLPNMPFPNIQIVPFGGGDNPFGGLGGLGGIGGIANPRPRGQPRLGIQIEKPSAVLSEQLDLPADSGVVVTAVTPGSVAEKVGLKANDVVLKLAGKDAPNEPAAFTELVARLKGGEKFEVVVLRKGKKETIKNVELPEAGRPAPLLRGGFSDFKMQNENGEITVRATADAVKYEVVGNLENNKLAVSKVVVRDGDEKAQEFVSVDKVPEKYKTPVEQIVARFRGRR